MQFWIVVKYVIMRRGMIWLLGLVNRFGSAFSSQGSLQTILDEWEFETEYQKGVWIIGTLDVFYAICGIPFLCTVTLVRWWSCLTYVFGQFWHLVLLVWKKVLLRLQFYVCNKFVHSGSFLWWLNMIGWNYVAFFWLTICLWKLSGVFVEFRRSLSLMVLWRSQTLETKAFRIMMFC